ncbi:MAG TPA: LCP family protein [Acidimicrobiia bacterium]|nr:LCP family protein [Acidimicrobiia bacterium]
MASTTHPSETSAPRRSSLAALASAVVPGWGQVYAGRRIRGRRLFLIDGAIFLSTLIALVWMRLDALKLWVSTSALAALTVANLLLLGYRWLAATDAYQLVVDRLTPRWQTNLMIGATAAVLIVPHLAFGYFTATQYSLINTVFGSGPGEVVTAAGDTTTTVVPSSTNGEGVVSTTAAQADTADPVLWDGLERLNILLLGADAGEGRTSIRTDTMILVSLDPETGDAAMFSVPRDMSGVPLPEDMGIWECNCFDEIVTNLYRTAEENPEAFPGPDEPGINAIRGAVGEIFGLPIHHYAMVTLDGFVDIVDALGGVTIEVPHTITDNEYPHENGTIETITIKEGTRHLNGHEALAYARIRRQSDDFARMHRQRCVLEAVIEQSSPTEILFRFGAIAEALKRSLHTDIPEERLADFIDLLPKLSTDRIASLRITRADYKIGSGDGVVYYDLDRIRADAHALMDDPAAAEAALGLDSLDGTCDSDPSSGF